MKGASSMSNLKKLTLCMVATVFVALFPLVVSAQDNMGDQMGHKMSATGCLMKGTSPDGYYLKGDDGKTYELWGYKGFSDHVNHKVTVSGMQKNMPDSMEKTKETNEKSEAAGQPQMDLKVSSLKMVSESCQ
jgi:hypothetical protein